MNQHFFDDSLVNWQTLAGFQHIHYWILDIDTEQRIVDVLFKFSANQQIVLHRHKALNKTFVLQGEHHIYHANGDLKETRAIGSYKVSPASDEPHREGGGSIDAVVLFSIRSSNDLFYEILDDDLNIIATLGMNDFVALFKQQTDDDCQL